MAWVISILVIAFVIWLINFVIWLINKDYDSNDGVSLANLAGSLQGSHFPFDKSTSGPTAREQTPSAELWLTAKVETQDFDGTALECLSVLAGGAIPSDYAGGTQLFLHLYDISGGGKGKMVLSAIDSLQEESTTVFQFSPPSVASPGSAFVEVTELVAIPLDALMPARGGGTTLRIKLSCCASIPPAKFVGGEHRRGGRVLDTATCRMTIQHWESGYEDLKDSKDKAIDCAIELAMEVAAADGDLDRREGQVVKKWLQKILGPDATDEEKNHCNSLLRSSGEKALAGRLRVSDVLSNLKKHTSKGFAIEVVDLCAEILTADGVASGSELTLVDEIIDGLGLDRKSTRSLIDKRIMTADIDLDLGSDPYSMLGVQAGMDSAEIKKRLMNEFKKWNARTTHEDPRIRERATEMLALIGKARKELV